MKRHTLMTCALALGATLTVAAQSYVPNRVFDSHRGAFSDFEAMAVELAKADVVFVGEQHDDPNTHRLELAVLESLARRGRSVIVSLEMFERDAQEPLEHFLMGHIAEEEFLKVSRPWPRYATDYKPLVDFAIAKEWPVVAANVPRPIASEVSKGGLEVLQQKSADDRKLFAAELKCPIGDDYFKRFSAVMGSHPVPGAGADEARRTTERYYASQCVKDETMAESIADARLASPRDAIVVHFDGAFHSDYAQGTVARVKRRQPGWTLAVVSAVPVADPAVAPIVTQSAKADFVIFTRRAQRRP